LLTRISAWSQIVNEAMIYPHKYVSFLGNRAQPLPSARRAAMLGFDECVLRGAKKRRPADKERL